MANMNMIIHAMEGHIELGDTFKNAKFRVIGGLRTFDRVVTNPMWNQDWWTENDYDADEFGRFPAGAEFPGKSSADWGWVQHVLASLNDSGKAVIVLDTGAASRGSGNAASSRACGELGIALKADIKCQDTLTKSALVLHTYWTCLQQRSVSLLSE